MVQVFTYNSCADDNSCDSYEAYVTLRQVRKCIMYII